MKWTQNSYHANVFALLLCCGFYLCFGFFLCCLCCCAAYDTQTLMFGFTTGHGRFPPPREVGNRSPFFRLFSFFFSFLPAYREQQYCLVEKGCRVESVTRDPAEGLEVAAEGAQVSANRSAATSISMSPFRQRVSFGGEGRRKKKEVEEKRKRTGLGDPPSRIAPTWDSLELESCGKPAHGNRSDTNNLHDCFLSCDRTGRRERPLETTMYPA